MSVRYFLLRFLSTAVYKNSYFITYLQENEFLLVFLIYNL